MEWLGERHSSSSFALCPKIELRYSWLNDSPPARVDLPQRYSLGRQHLLRAGAGGNPRTVSVSRDRASPEGFEDL